MTKVKNVDHPPKEDCERPCADCGTSVRFKRYWSVTDNKYLRPTGHCPTCRRQINLRADGTQAPRAVGTCPTCGGRKGYTAAQCVKCRDAERAKQVRDWPCQYEYCSNTIASYRERRYCSPRCCSLENKRRHRGRTARNRRVFRRDAALVLAFQHGYRCHICGELIDVSLGPTDRMSLTIDHVVPVALGGTDDVDNLRPAHRVCNSIKGART
jgi:5-methylcytosine-specific restriction endonuclease McrA